MPVKNTLLPLSLYIHMPWCIKKCPYCDFNSHKLNGSIPETDYINALVEDLKKDIFSFGAKSISSIFIGGGTPSLFTPEAYELLFNQLKKYLHFVPDIEITLEANPGTFEAGRYKAYRELGINRLSLGVQSFNPNHLKALGRIHDEKQAFHAIEEARKAGFKRINLDIMHGLPNQTIEEGLADLTQAIAFAPEHISWYQLTIEPNTVFYKQQPTLPSDDVLCDIEQKGFFLLEQAGFQRYEISAFCQPGEASRHNLNYWHFGDYIGIGAGAHGKLTTADGVVLRTQKMRQPKDYLDPHKTFLASLIEVSPEELVFEFMLNTTRLEHPIPLELFKQTTGLELEWLLPGLEEAQKQQLVELKDNCWQITAFGRRFTNNLQSIFLT